MKKYLFPAAIVGIALLLFSYAALYLTVTLLPSVAEEYYNPMFSLDQEKAPLFFIHPFILSLALAWFWERFKGVFKGNAWLRGLELGLVYGFVATLPSTWMTFSALSISLMMVTTWFVYGVLQATIAGWILARMNP